MPKFYCLLYSRRVPQINKGKPQKRWNWHTGVKQLTQNIQQQPNSTNQQHQQAAPTSSTNKQHQQAAPTSSTNSSSNNKQHQIKEGKREQPAANARDAVAWPLIESINLCIIYVPTHALTRLQKGKIKYVTFWKIIIPVRRRQPTFDLSGATYCSYPSS